MKRPVAVALLALATVPAFAHDYPIKPVSVVLRVEPDRVVADIDGDSVYWIEEVVGLHPMPPRDWPADALAKAEKYANEHLRLRADGHPLNGRLLSATYAQKPWEVNENGRVHLRLSYPPVADGVTVSGDADFFEDYRLERLEGHEPVLPFQDFRTLLTVPGRSPSSFELKPGATAFSVAAADARRAPAALAAESVTTGAAGALGAIEGWTALAALALSLAPGFASRRRLAGLLAAGILGSALPLPGPLALLWAAGVVAALSAGRWLGEGATPWLEALAAVALARAWSAQALVRLPRAVPGPLERIPAAAGALVAASLAVALGVAAATAERRALAVHSQSRAADLFARRRRLAATALLLVSAFGLIAALPR
jgi:hypothetical protein